MRGSNDLQHARFRSCSPEDRVPATHPLRAIKASAEAALAELSGTVETLYSPLGRPSIPPERLLQAPLLIALYAVRSDELFCERLASNILFRGFLDMDLEEASVDPTTFTKNRERLLAHHVARKFFDAVVGHVRAAGLLSDAPFTGDGTLLEAWASRKSFKAEATDARAEPRPDDPGNPTVDFPGESRSNAPLTARRMPRRG